MTTTDTRSVLDHIRARHGRLTPRIVVDDSRDPEAPLHHRFEWDDDVAGEKYRRIQAAQIIRSVHVKVIDEPDKPEVQVRAFLPVKNESDEDPDTPYEPIEQVARDAQMLAFVRAQMEREWRQLRRKYQAHEHFWAMVLTDAEPKRQSA